MGLGLGTLGVVRMHVDAGSAMADGDAPVFTIGTSHSRRRGAPAKLCADRLPNVSGRARATQWE